MNREVSSGSSEKFKRRWASHFACNPLVIAVVWSLIGQEDELLEPQHILWAVMLLTQYSSDSDLAGKCEGVHEDTFQKWSWHYINLIASLESDVVRIPRW
jgi:hypothetical protein